MLIIGLTGGIGSGKSTVSAIFEELGVPVIDADVIAHELVEPDQKALKLIADAFGQNLIGTDGKLKRRQLRDIIHADQTKKNRLESILHPLIKEEILDRIKQLNSSYCIIVVPLLLESGWQELVNRILVIDSTIKQQKERIQTRDQLSHQQANLILRNQTDRQNRLAAADDIIDNSHGISELMGQVRNLHERYLVLSQQAK